MRLLRDRHEAVINGVRVTVTGHSGWRAKWQLAVDDRLADSVALFAGSATLTGTLPDGSEVQATLYQSLVGPTTVTLTHNGDAVASFAGFVL